VWAAEKVSVDIVKTTPDQTIAGHHAQNHPSARGVGVFARISDKLAAGRELRQSCGSTITVQLIPFFSVRSSVFSVSRSAAEKGGVFHPKAVRQRNEHARETSKQDAMLNHSRVIAPAKRPHSMR
jgi:hypothetical protein